MLSGRWALLQRGRQQPSREKDTTITRAEHEAVLIGILLHDIGHGPVLTHP